MRPLIMWEEGLKVLEECIKKAGMILDGYQPGELFTSVDYMKYYDCIYYMSVQRDPYSYTPQLRERFKRALEESIAIRVLPSLRDKSDSTLLLELTNMWAKYKKMANCLGGIFQYLERGKIGESLIQTSARCFHDLVCYEHYEKFQAAAISLNRKDRDDETPLDRDLLQSVSTFFVDMGLGKKFYYINFENAILADAASYYSQLALRWRMCYSFTVYVQKTALCLTKEKARASQFLYQDSVEKLLQVAQSHMLNEVTNQLLEMKKAESSNGSGSVEELLSLCANLNLEDGGSSMC